MTKQPGPAAVDPVFHMHEITKVYPSDASECRFASRNDLC